MRTANLTVARYTIRAIADRLARTVAAVVVVRRSVLSQGRLLHQPPQERGFSPRAWGEFASALVFVLERALGLCPCALAACRLPERAGQAGARPGMPGQCR